MYAADETVVVALIHGRQNGMNSIVKDMFHQRNLLVLWSFQPIVDHLLC